MLHIDLFSGIGGFALAAETVWPGIEHIFCDNEPFSQQVLRKHWPNSKIYGDIRTLTNTNVVSDTRKWSKEERRELGSSTPNQDCLLLTGGFPCQPFSQAGRRQGTADDRYLWPEMFRVIREFSPLWVIAENVRGLLSWNDGLVLEQVCADLESEGYEVQPLVIPAVAVNAPHRRDRIWFVARNTKYDGQHGSQDGQGGTSGSDSDTAGTNKDEQSTRPTVSRNDAQNPLIQRSGGRSKDGGQILERQSPKAEYQRPGWPDWNRDWREVASATCNDRVDDGLPKRMVRLPDGSTITKSKWRQQALKAYGNAIVPAVAIEIMLALKSK